MPAWYYNYNMSLVSYIIVASEKEQEGYWPVSLSMYPYFNGTYHEPRYAGVWHWRPGGPHKVSRLALIKASELESKLAKWANAGVFPRLVGAFQGSLANLAEDTFFSLVGWTGPETMLSPGLPFFGPLVRGRVYWSSVNPLLDAWLGTQATPWHDAMDAQRYHPVAMTSYTTSGQAKQVPDHGSKLAIIWEKQRASRQLDGWYYWNILGVENARVEHADTVLREGFASPHLVCPVPLAGGLGLWHLLMYRDDKIPGSVAHFGVTPELLNNNLYAWIMGSAGYWPLCMQSTREGPGQVFDFVWAKAGHAKEPPRILRRRGVDAASRDQALQKPKPFPKQPESSSSLGGVQSAPIASESAVFPTTVAQQVSSLEQTAPRARAAGSTWRASWASLPKFMEPMRDMILLSGDGAPPMKATPAPLFKPDTTVFTELEDLIIAHMKKYDVRGAQVAVCRNGELKLATALTWAEESYPLVTPTKRMRFGSISKTVTAFAIHYLVEQLKNTSQAINIFSTTNGNDIGSLLGVSHPGWSKRSVAHLLTHLAYFDYVDDTGIDYLADYVIANHLQNKSTPLPPGASLVERTDELAYVRGLDLPGSWFFDPSSVPVVTTDVSAQAASNYDGFNYALLGQIIAEQDDETGDYEGWVKREIFDRLGTARPQRGTEKYADAVAEKLDEVWYHPSRPELWDSIWNPIGFGFYLPTEWGAPAYEGHNYRRGLAGGQWSLAMVDYARLLSSVDVPGALLTDPVSFERLLEKTYVKGGTLGFGLNSFPKRSPPGGPPYKPGPIDIGPQPPEQQRPPSGPSLSHRVVSFGGAWAGTSALTFRREDTVVVVVSVNGSPPVGLDAVALSQALDFPEEQWPEGDLFDEVLDDL
jgi:CubicO group peptidase (beta-lactamase class C family)